MTIATLLGTALVYKIFVVDQNADMSADDLMKLKLTVLSVSAIACIAISVAGDTSQDLKTGFLVKATPYKQQVGEMIGVLTSVLAIAGVILLLNDTMGFVKGPDHPNPLPAYQANIMKVLTDGVLGGQVPWTLILIGGAAAVVIEMLGLPALPFAVGMYLPLGLSTPIMIGGLIAWWVQRKRKKKADHDVGVLTASGLVAGQGLIGVAMAGVMALISWWWEHPRWSNPLAGQEEPVVPAHLGPWLMDRFDWIPTKWGLCDVGWDALPMAPFLLLAIWLWWCARKRPAITLPPDTGAVAAPPKPVRPPSSDAPPESSPSTTNADQVSADPRAPQPDVVTPLPAAPSSWAPSAPEDAEPSLSTDDSASTDEKAPPDPFALPPEDVTPVADTPSPWAPPAPEDVTSPPSSEDTPPPRDVEPADREYEERSSLLGEPEGPEPSDSNDLTESSGDDIDEALRASRRRLEDLGSNENA